MRRRAATIDNGTGAAFEARPDRGPRAAWIAVALVAGLSAWGAPPEPGPIGATATQAWAGSGAMATKAPAVAWTRDEIVARTLAARGGADRLRAMRSARVTGRLSLHPGVEVPFTLEWRRPNRLRLEYTIQGMTAVQAYDGETGWAIAPFHGGRRAETLDGEALARFAESADFEGALVDWQTKGHRLEYLGLESVEGTAAHVLRLELASGTVRTVYLDAESFLEILQVSRTPDGAGGWSEETELTSGDYQEVAGIQFAFWRDRRPRGAASGQVQTVRSIDLDVELADERFARPAGGS